MVLATPRPRSRIPGPSKWVTEMHAIRTRLLKSATKVQRGIEFRDFPEDVNTWALRLLERLELSIAEAAKLSIPTDPRVKRRTRKRASPPRPSPDLF